MPNRRNTTPDVLTTMRGALLKIAADYQSQLSTRGLRSLPPGAREFVNAARSALTEAQTAIDDAARSVPALLADRRVYPQGRTDAARAKLADLEALVADKTAVAQKALEATKVVLTKQSLRPVDRREEMVARADAQMILDRTDPASRDAVMMRLAQRQDAIGALVSSQWGRDYLSTVTTDSVLADAMFAGITESAVSAAAGQNLDEARRDAAQHLDTLPALHGMRDAVMHTGRMITESLRDDHNLPAGTDPSPEFEPALDSQPDAALPS
jgi:hypothetical protein